MARANLNVSREVIDQFIFSQDSRTTRLLVVKIRDENIVLDPVNGVVDRQGSVSNDFDTLLPQYLQLDQASFGLFCLSDETVTGSSLAWMLISWVPDGCRVRDKMLYSSSREDLKRTLGLGYFKSDYVANVVEDLTWNHYLESQRKEITEDILTETERLVIEEKTLSQAESGMSKATALSVIPFQLSASARQALQEFQNDICNWAAFTIAAETIELLDTQVVNISNDTDLGQFVRNDTASFIALKCKDVNQTLLSFFIFSCPEDVPIRQKMMMSSSKASVLAAASEQGLKFDKLLEIRDSADLDALIKSECNPVSAETVFTASSTAAATAGKPQRPGKGRAKVSKFQSDDA